MNDDEAKQIVESVRDIYRQQGVVIRNTGDHLITVQDGERIATIQPGESLRVGVRGDGSFALAGKNGGSGPAEGG